MSTRFAIVFAPPGKRIQTTHFLQKFFPSTSIHDIETRITTTNNVDHIRDLITSKTRQFLKEGWECAIHQIISNIFGDAHLKNKPNILVGHSLYYNGNTREFFPLFDASFFKKQIGTNGYVSHIVLVIDDIFDLFDYLTQPTGLYSQRHLRIFFELYAKSTGKQFYDLDKDPKAYTNWISHCLTSLLEWRAKEMILAQNISTQLDSKFILWGIKQDLQVLGKFLEKKNEKIFYVSHPISEPRATLRKTNEWPSLVSFINKLQIELRNKELLTVMPTAIDEYRLAKNNEDYTAKLDLRWPVPQDILSNLRDENVSLIDDNYDKIDVLHPWDIELKLNNVDRKNLADVAPIQDFLNGVYSSLDMRIEYDLGNRDHLLVWCTDGMIVIEPIKRSTHKVSGGVKMELEYLQRVNDSIKQSVKAASLKDYRKLCVVISRNSVEEIFREDGFKSKLVPKLRSIVKSQHGLTEYKVESIIQESGQLKDDVSSLGVSIDDTVFNNIKENLDNYKKRTIIELLSTILTIDPENLEYVVVLVVDELKDLLTEEKCFEKLKDFLIASIPIKWQDELYNMAQDLKLFE